MGVETGPAPSGGNVRLVAYDPAMKKAKIAVGAGSVLVALTTAVTGCSDSEKDTAPFMTHGFVTASSSGLDAYAPEMQTCTVRTKKGMVQTGSVVTVLVDETRAVGTTTLGAGTYTETSSGTLGGKRSAECRWEFTVEVHESADSYTVRIGDGAETTLSSDMLRDGGFMVAVYTDMFGGQ